MSLLGKSEIPTQEITDLAMKSKEMRRRTYGTESTSL